MSSFDNTITFDQINVHHCREATSVVRCRLDDGATCVCLIQEPYCYKGGVKGLGSSGSIHVVLSQEGSARACVYTNRRINATLLREYSTSDFVAVRIVYECNSQMKTVICCSCYLPYEGEVPTREMVKLVDYCTGNNIDLIIGCDANSHHVMWGSSDTNARGRRLMEFICESGLIVLNQGNNPTFSNRIRQEVIDITLCSPSLQGSISSWHVSDEDSMSDHATIMFNIPQVTIPPVKFRNPRKTNWDSFTERMRWRLGLWDPNISCVEDLESSVNELTESLVLSFEEACPLRKQSIKCKTYWYSDRLAKLKAACNYAWNHRLRNGMEPVRIARNAYKRECRKSKRDSWRSFCESVEGVSPTARIHKILAKDRLNQVDSLKLPNGEYLSEEPLILKHLLETHFPDCVDPSVEMSSDINMHVNGHHVWRRAGSIVSPKNIRWAINTFQPFKAAGKDKIFPAMLQHAVSIIVNPLHKIFTASLVFGHIPEAWQQVKVVFIPKPGRSSYEEAKSHRPISLSSFLLKTLERMVDRQIREVALREIPLCHNQHAYQRGKSTMTAVHKLTQFLESSMECNEHSLACFLDIEGAFDRASFDSFRKAALEHNVDTLLIRWILCMLHDRILTAELRGSSVRMRPVKGCPQGGVLSPLIWILIANGLIQRLNAAKIFNVGYADDFSIVARGKFINVVYDRMSEALRIVNDFTLSNGLSVNPSKTGLMLFTRSRKLAPPSIQFQGQVLPLSRSWKILGLEFDDKLNWGQHIELRVKKACMIFGQCRRAIGRSWGLSPRCTLWLYTMVVMPVLCYGAVVWWKKAQQASVGVGFNHLQRMSLLSITGAMSTTPTAALELLLGLEPLNIRIEASARAELYRLHCWGQLDLNRGSSGHASLWRKMVHEEPQWEAPKDYMVPCRHLDHAFKVLIPEREAWNEGFLLQTGAEIILYTDGSLREGLAGAGVYSAGLGISSFYPLGTNVSVFQSEIFAISMCASTCRQIGIQNSRIAICVDSQAALQALNSNLFESKLVLTCFWELNKLAHENEVFLVWVPAHCGIQGNEEVDALAKLGSDINLTGPLPSLPLAKSWARQTINDWTRKKVDQRWANLQSCRQTKDFLRKSLPLGTVSMIRNLPRGVLRYLTGVLTGHFTFKKHLNRIGLSEETLCPRCEEDEDTAFHLLCNCPVLALRRKKYLGDYTLSERETSRIKIDAVLSFISGIDF